MNYKTIFYFILFYFLITGCSMVSNNAQNEKMYLEMPQYIASIPNSKRQNTHNRGSLFNRGNSPSFGDRKAMRVNDLLTVVISETANSSTQASKQLDDSSKYDLGGGILGARDNTQPNALSNALAGLNNLSNVKFNSSSTSAFSGSGTTTRNESFSTNITARIIKSMTNNTYYIKGSRELLINGEHQYISIAGVIRADDISKNNMINSKYISDAKIYYATKGSVAVASKVSWGSRLVKNIWPF